MDPLVVEAIVAFAGGALCVATGIGVLLVRPASRVNRAVATFFVTGGLTIVPARMSVVVESEGIMRLLAQLDAGFGTAILAAYLLLVGVTLRTPLAAPFRVPWVRGVLWAIIPVGLAAPFLAPDLYVVGLERAPHDWAWSAGPILSGVIALEAVVALFALVCAVDTVRRAARGTPERSRARGYLLTFGVLDGFGAALLVLMNTLQPSPFQQFLQEDALAILVVLVYPALAYQVVRRQVVDLDLHVRLTVKRSGIVAAFAAAFWLGEQLLQQLIPVQGFVLGLASAAVLALAFRPLERACARLADRLVPAAGTPVDARKLDVYRAAVESAWEEDGRLDERSRALLERLRAKLGVPLHDAQRLEAEVAAA